MKLSVLIAALAVSCSHAFVVGGNRKTSSTTALQMGMFDDVKYFFSEEGKAERAALKEQQIKEMEEAQREILERRTDPEAMGRYEEEIQERRFKYMQEKQKDNEKDNASSYL